MSPVQRPGARNVNKGRLLIDRLEFNTTPYVEDIAAAQVYALLGIADALGDIALSLRSAIPPPPRVPVVRVRKDEQW